MIRYLLSLLLAGQVMACASLQPTEEALSYDLIEQNRLNVLAIDEWRLIGRLAVRVDNDSWLSRLEWEHGDNLDTLVVSTFLGGVLAKLDFIGNDIYFTDSDGVVRIIAESELESMLGYVPPVHQLKYWVRGLAAPLSPVDGERLVDGRRGFKQKEWQVEQGRFSRTVAGIFLPKKITVIRRGVKIKLVVEEWVN